MSAAIDEAAQLAVNLARNSGYLVFPCLENERPACPQGPKSASSDSATIARLWWDWPGPLVGIATGPASNLWVLSVDAKHRDAVMWWRASHHRLLPTRAYATRSRGIHLHYRDSDNIGSTTNRICKGVDTHGDGGFAIFWFAAGYACHDPSPPAPWPDWLRNVLAMQRPPEWARRAIG